MDKGKEKENDAKREKYIYEHAGCPPGKGKHTNEELTPQ